MGQRTQTRLAWLAMPALAAMLALATPARADQLGIDISTDRGNDAVYQPGDPLQLHIRVSNDAYVLAYEIDSEGYVKLLYPLKGQTGLRPPASVPGCNVCPGATQHGDLRTPARAHTLRRCRQDCIAGGCVTRGRGSNFYRCSRNMGKEAV